MDDRTVALRLLWSAVRKAGGEEALRAAVATMNDRDATNASARGTDEYSSTKLLELDQLRELAARFRKTAGLPAPSWRPRGARGGAPRRPSTTDPARVSYLASQGERDYVEHLFDLLGFSDEAQAAFVRRQTKGAGLASHRDANAVTVPLERMLRGRGWVGRAVRGVKRWTAPQTLGEGHVPELGGDASAPPTGVSVPSTRPQVLAGEKRGHRDAAPPTGEDQ